MTTNNYIKMFMQEIENSNKTSFEKWTEMYRAIERLKEEKEKYLNEIYGE